MPTTGHDSGAECSAVIYLCGNDQKQLDDAERRCREYADRFGWPILESIRDNGTNTNADQLLAKASQLRAHIILTDTLDMISPDQDTRDDLMMFLERAECIVHPVTMPCHS